MKKVKSLLALSLALALTGCNSSDNGDAQAKEGKALNLTLLHINDHHSKLDATDNFTLLLQDKETQVSLGGFPRLVSKVNDLASQHENVLKLHAGDAMTGTMYYSLFREELPDTLMMNQVCFDAFALGNHEFDDGNTQLSHFMDKLAEGNCGTPVLAANIEVPETNPIFNKYQPYVIKEFNGEKVAIIGLDISGKTQASSSPSEDTVFLDEVETAQKYIDQLKADGINKIILLSHYTYKNDIAMAKSLRDVDVIVGGDSHTLLGNKTVLEPLGLLPSGDYPTIVNNASGDQVCIVQAWENAKALGELSVSFNAAGQVTECSGHPHLMLGDTFQRDKQPVSEADKALIETQVANTAELSLVDADVATATLLDTYKSKIDEKKAEIIGTSLDNLCAERVPGQNHPHGDICLANSPERDFLNQHGSVMASIVSEAFKAMSLRSDIAIQNTGGVRNSIPAGDVSVGHAFDVLPFTNLLVNLDMTGQEILNTIEDAIDNVVVNNSTGAFPAAANLRFDLDMTAAKGSRISNVEVRRRNESVWSPIQLDATYVVVTNDFIAAGGDRYDAMVPVYNDPARREDTGLLYTDSLINYIKAMTAANQPLSQPAVSEMMVQSYTPLP